MRNIYDLNSDRLIRGLHSPTDLPFNRLEMKSATAAPLEWQFVRPFLAAEELAEEDGDVTIKFGGKPVHGFDDDFLVSNWDGDAWAHTLAGAGATAVYATPITWDSEELRDLLEAAEVSGRDYVDLAGVLKVLIGATVVREALNFTVRIFRSYISGVEGFGTPPNPDYPLPAAIELLAHKGQPTGYAGLDEDGKVPADNLPAVEITAAAIAALDLSLLPTSNPGGGRLWLNGGVLQVGA